MDDPAPLVRINLKTGRTEAPRHITAALSECEHVTLRIEAENWVLEEQHDSIESLTARMAEAEATRLSQVTAFSRFNSWNRPVEFQAGNRLSYLIHRWQTSKAKLDRHGLALLSQASLLERTVIMAMDQQAQDLTYRFIGDEFVKTLGDWCFLARGTPISETDDHDPEYSEWCANAYNATFESQIPARELIDATIKSPTGGRAQRVNYDRVMIPTSLIDGTPALMVVSQRLSAACPLR